MSTKPARPCKHPGCPVLTRDGWCDKHKPLKRRCESEAYHAWYMLPIWTQVLRPQQLISEPFCRECAKIFPPDDPRHRTPASVVDHVKPHRGEWSLFVDRDNLQSLCKHHHDQKTMREQLERMRQPR